MTAIATPLIGRTIGMMGVSGIYALVHLDTGKCYVGSTVSLKSRISYHRSKLRNNRHDNSYLQRAWNKYGEDAFAFILLELCSKDDLMKSEAAWMLRTQCCDKRVGFNLDKIAIRKMHCEETKKKIGAAHLGRKYPPEFGKKVSAAWAARTEPVARRTPEQKERHRIANTGRVFSAEARLNMGRSRKGRIITPEWRAKLSAATKGRKLSEEHRRKLTEVNRNRAKREREEKWAHHPSLPIYLLD